MRWKTMLVCVALLGCDDDEGNEKSNNVLDGSIDAGGDAGKDATLDAKTNSPIDAAVACVSSDCSTLLGTRCSGVTYDQKLAEVNAKCADSGSFYIGKGTCSDGKRWLSTSGGFGGPTFYFTLNGTLVGARTTSDAIDVQCRGVHVWGDAACPGESGGKLCGFLSAVQRSSR